MLSYIHQHKKEKDIGNSFGGIVRYLSAKHHRSFHRPSIHSMLFLLSQKRNPTYRTSHCICVGLIETIKIYRNREDLKRLNKEIGSITKEEISEELLHEQESLLRLATEERDELILYITNNVQLLLWKFQSEIF